WNWYPAVPASPAGRADSSTRHPVPTAAVAVAASLPAQPPTGCVQADYVVPAWWLAGHARPAGYRADSDRANHRHVHCGTGDHEAVHAPASIQDRKSVV